MSQYNYVVTVYDSNSITGAIYADLFGDGIDRLILVKPKSLLIYDINKGDLIIPNNLESNEVSDIPILRLVGEISTYKNIIQIAPWRPKGQEFDDILIYTEQYELILIRAYKLQNIEDNSTDSSVLYLNVIQSKDLFRPNLRKSNNIKMIIDSYIQRIILLIYEGCLQVVDCYTDLSLKMSVFTPPIMLRLSELNILDLCLINSSSNKCLLGILYDSGYSEDPRLLKLIDLPSDLKSWTYNMRIGMKIPSNIMKIVNYEDFNNDPLSNGLLLFGDGSVFYLTIGEILYNNNENLISQPLFIQCNFPSNYLEKVESGLTLPNIVDAIPIDGKLKRWLVLDNTGGLFIMVVYKDQNLKIENIKVDILGQYSPFSVLLSLKNDIYFIGSKICDSLVLYIYHNKPLIMQIIHNIGPIRDLLFIRDNEYREDIVNENPLSNTQISKNLSLPLVAACGFGNSGSFKIICNGIGLNQYLILQDLIIPYTTRLYHIRLRNTKFDMGSYSKIYIIQSGHNFTKFFTYNMKQEDFNDTYYLNIRKEVDTDYQNNTNFTMSNNIHPRSFSSNSLLSMKEVELSGLISNEETLQICFCSNGYFVQVTPRGIFTHGIGKDNKLNAWIFQDFLKSDTCELKEFFNKFNHSELNIEKAHIDEKNSFIVLCLTFGVILVGRVEELGFRVVTSKIVSQILEELNKVDIDTNFDNFNFVDEISSCGVFFRTDQILIFISTWQQPDILCFEFNSDLQSTGDQTINLICRFHTGFQNHELLITCIYVSILSQEDGHKKNHKSIDYPLYVLIGTSQGHLQLYYDSSLSSKALENNFETMNTNLDKSKSNILFYSCDNTRSKEFELFSTWKVSNTYISNIYPLNMHNNDINLLICCEQPKILHWKPSYKENSIGLWTFYNIHSPWISQAIQLDSCDTKLTSTSKSHETFILYLCHHIDQNLNASCKLANTQPQEELNIRSNIEKPNIIKLTHSLRASSIDILQQYHCRSLQLNFTPERICYISNLNVYVVVGIWEKGLMKNSKSENKFLIQNNSTLKSSLSFVQALMCVISANNLEILHFKTLESSVYPTCLEYIELNINQTPENISESFIVLGTNKVGHINDYSNKSPNIDLPIGKLTLFSIRKLHSKFIVDEETSINAEGCPYAITRFQLGTILVAVENSVVTYEIIQYSTSSNYLKDTSILPSSSSSSSSCLLLDTLPENEKTPKFKFNKINSYSTHTMIVFLKLWKDEYLLVGDLMRSVGLWKYDKVAKQFEEICRDPSLAWVMDGIFINKNLYMVSDENKNVRILTKPENPINDEMDTVLQSIAHFHSGEIVSTFQKGKLMMPYPRCLQEINNIGLDFCHSLYSEQIVFGTAQGSMSVIFSLNADYKMFLQLIMFEEAIIAAIKKSLRTIYKDCKVCNLSIKQIKQLYIKESSSSFSGVIGTIGGEDVTPFQWNLSKNYQDYNYEYECSGASRGFISGDIIELFLKFSNELQEMVIQELKAIQIDNITIPETSKQLEHIIQQLRNIH
ncbi:CPSF A subunit domain-containing protein [Cryptosporidium muris RN66]|uniref:CPSF A subunit domain-containing protein n=1 Tax=Cryptosporidium muris (strain RN66) TaxID=441375 RepID=B6AI49_CRYMR|nr:CPSF A subunit domain-containing protein [Cryptosporidium muris RN66]EEA07890.1 CPSF A subunit domain-containing protein [Cryptosporidium muris RN66]|eukprot:XP_002142239.1 CPSF A subunit domain-containing protein [Cryptosporidium muris RN66]